MVKAFVAIFVLPYMKELHERVDAPAVTWRGHGGMRMEERSPRSYGNEREVCAQ